MSEKTTKFVYGGPVQVDGGIYLERPADKELFEVCRQRKFAYVLACRQIGKSSLMNETGRKLRDKGVRTAVIDLTEIGRTDDEDKWYYSLFDQLSDWLDIKTKLDSWWEGQSALLTSTRRFLQFLREVVLREITAPIVIFVDEIDFTLGLDFTDDFFAAIRSVYQDRVHNQDFERLTFVLLGMATPNELIADSRHTPFNIGQAIGLHDFTSAECAPFRLELETHYPGQGGDYFDQIYNWTNGHPYLTQRLCAEVLVSSNETPNRVETLVKHLFFSPEARGESNIQYVQRSVTRDQYAQAMLKVYKRVIEGTIVADDEKSVAINRLKLYGLVVNQNGQLIVRNNIYAQVFDSAWAEEMLKNIGLGLPDKYTILRRIDQRGFITVHLAQREGKDDPERDEVKNVALKILKVPEEAKADWDNWIKKLEEKAQEVAEAKHPNVIDIYETGLIDEKTLYIAMEHIPGSNLRAQLKKGPWPLSKAMEIVRQIGAALTHTHIRGIFHLAVNPNDILVDTQSDPPRFVLTDFGLAKCLLEEPQSQLKPAYIKQTHQYIAPEQGDDERLVPTTDIYGLAISFFEALAGKLPPDRQPGEPLPPLSKVASELGPHFDEILCRATDRDPAKRFDTVTDFVEAVEAAHKEAERIELFERQQRAATLIDAARGYIEKKGYDPEKALPMVEAALEVYPGQIHALLLRGRIRWQQGETDQALTDYAEAYEQEGEPSSIVGREYLEVLSQAADLYWQQEAFQEAAEHYETIREVVVDQSYIDETVQEIQQVTWSRLVEYHRREAERVYSLDAPETIAEALSIFEQKLVDLENLVATSEIEDLQSKLSELQQKKYEAIINQAQAEIDRFKTQDNQTRFSDETIFQHYLALDEAFQALLKLERNGQWLEKRREKLAERIELRLQFADDALEKRPEADYETALRHYLAIRDIESTSPGIADELNLALHEKIKDLETKADLHGKYNDIQQHINDREFTKALEYLNRDFIQTGNYEYQDVAKWLWKLVYAKQNNNRLPPEFVSMFISESLTERQASMQQERILELKAKLEPWSQARILETVGRGSKLLGEFEEQLEGVETMLNQAIASGIADRPEVEKCRQDLEEARTQIHTQLNTYFQIDVTEIAKKVETWLCKLDEMIDMLNKTDKPLGDIPVFFDRIEENRVAIEQDSVFSKLSNLFTVDSEIGQTIDRVKLRSRRRIIRMLVDDIGARDEELAKARKELAKSRRSGTDTKVFIWVISVLIGTSLGSLASSWILIDVIWEPLNPRAQGIVISSFIMGITGIVTSIMRIFNQRKKS